MYSLFNFLNSNLFSTKGLKDHEISKITDDSRKCRHKGIYVCTVQNEEVGKKYVIEAIKNRANTIFLPVNYHFTSSAVNIIKVYSPEVILARLLKYFYQDKKMPFFIGITGTCGKTTTATLVYELLKKNSEKVLFIGTSGYYGWNEHHEYYEESINTTPRIVKIYELLFSSDFDYRYVVMEVSSQALATSRILGLKFNIVIFLNLSKEHLDYHKNMDNYFNAKAKLFNMVDDQSIGLINSDFIYQNKLFNISDIICKTFGIQKGDYQVEIIEDNMENLVLKINNELYSTRLAGNYNASNIAACLAIKNLLNIKDAIFKIVLENAIIPGRNQLYLMNKRYIVIDYAHTINEVEAIINHLVNHKKNKLIIVIGCGGNRDREKRPIIGNITTNYADRVVFTADNSRNEKTIDIIQEIISGAEKQNYDIVIKRDEAIKKAVEISKPGDTIALIGKGTEKIIICDKNTVVFNDYDCIRSILKEEDEHE